MAIRFLSNQTIDSTLDLTGRVKVSGSSTDQYFYEGARTGVGVTLRLYDNANNIYFDSYKGISLRANQIGGSGGNITTFGGGVGAGKFLRGLYNFRSEHILKFILVWMKWLSLV